MKLTEEQMAAAVDLVRHRVSRGEHPNDVCLALAAGQLAGRVSASAMMEAYSVAVRREDAEARERRRWGGEGRERPFETEDLDMLALSTGRLESEVPGGDDEAEADAARAESLREVVAWLLRKVGVVPERHRVKHRESQVTVRAGESWQNVEGAGSEVVAGKPVEWVFRAVVVRGVDGEVRVVLPEARGWADLDPRYSGEVLRYKQPVIDMSELDLRRAAVNLAVLLKLFGARGGSAADIARMAGVERATVSHHQRRLAGEIVEESGERRLLGLGKPVERKGEQKAAKGTKVA